MSSPVSAPAAESSRSPPKDRRPWVITIIVMVLLIAGWLLWSGLFDSKPPAKPPAPVPIGAGRVKLGDIDVYLDALGTVTPVYTDTIVSRVSGMVTEVHFSEGQIVKKNDLLAIIDPRPYDAALLQAQGQLARDQALLKNARLDLARYQNSYKEHAIPEQQLATQQATVDEDEGTVRLDKGNLAAAQVNVDYTRITSPIDGRVGLRDIDPGNVVTANGTSPLCVITQLNPITVIFVIAEDAIDEVFSQMQPGHALTVIALDRSKQKTLDTGRLLTVDNQVNTTTGTVRARAIFPNENRALFPSQFVNARLLVKTLKKVNLVPQGAIQHNNDITYVYVIGADYTVQSRNVQVLATDADTSAITGVSPGDRLVTDGFDKLQNGSKVEVREEAVQGPTVKDPG